MVVVQPAANTITTYPSIPTPCSLFSEEPMFKRGVSEGDNEGGALVKKVRYEDDDSSSSSNALTTFTYSGGELVSKKIDQIKRTSSLDAPTMSLSGHDKAIYAISLDPSGQNLASASFDKTIFLWNVYGDCANYNVLTGSKNAILGIEWASNGNHIMSCSADKTVSIWDANKGVRIRKFTDHEGIVNCVAVAKNDPCLFISGSDDCTAKIWDSRTKWAVQSIEHEYQITSIAMADDGRSVFTGGIDNVIRKFNLTDDSHTPDLSMEGHMDTITGLALSPDGSYLLSNAMDSTLRKWDVRPFTISDRCLMSYEGVHHGAEKGLLKASWSSDGEMVSCGSADRIVHIWDSTTGRQLYYLPGHKGAVNEVLFHPKEPIVVSCSSDKTIFLGELMED